MKKLRMSNCMTKNDDLRENDRKRMLQDICNFHITAELVKFNLSEICDEVYYLTLLASANRFMTGILECFYLSFQCEHGKAKAIEKFNALEKYLKDVETMMNQIQEASKNESCEAHVKH